MTMTHNFETNIEKRMPDTGKVFFVDRMTSDYATAHPFDVDEYIESVYQKFAGTEFAESREDMRRMWTAVLSVKSQRGDASLYPNRNGGKHPALIEVWGKAGDYWRRGLHIGDVLPAIVPGCKITRLDNGEWIALFQKDADLLNTNGHKCTQMATNESNAQPLSSHQGEGAVVWSETPILPESLDTKPENHEIVAQREQSDARIDYAESQHNSTESQIVPQDNTTTDSTDDTDVPVINACEITSSEDFGQILEDFEPTGDHEPAEQNDAPVSLIAVAASDDAPAEEKSAVEKQEPQQLDLFAQMQAEINTLKAENQELRNNQCNMIQEQASACSPTPAPSPTRRRGTAGGERQMSVVEMIAERERRQTEQASRAYGRLYGSPAITVDHTDDHSDRNRKIFAAVATAVVFIVLVNTIGLFGIAALGLLAGGIIK